MKKFKVGDVVVFNNYNYSEMKNKIGIVESYSAGKYDVIFHNDDYDAWLKDLSFDVCEVFPDEIIKIGVL
jgi:hypothetical protein